MRRLKLTARALSTSHPSQTPHSTRPNLLVTMPLFEYGPIHACTAVPLIARNMFSFRPSSTQINNRLPTPLCPTCGKEGVSPAITPGTLNHATYSSYTACSGAVPMAAGYLGCPELLCASRWPSICSGGTCGTARITQGWITWNSAPLAVSQRLVKAQFDMLYLTKTLFIARRNIESETKMGEVRVSLPHSLIPCPGVPPNTRAAWWPLIQRVMTAVGYSQGSSTFTVVSTLLDRNSQTGGVAASVKMSILWVSRPPPPTWSSGLQGSIGALGCKRMLTGRLRRSLHVCNVMPPRCDPQ
jgi:hypothetical protein